MQREPGVPDRATLAAFAGTVLIGGSNFLAVKFSNEDIDPQFGAALRFAAAATIFFVLTAVLRLSLPRGKALLGAALYGLLGFGVSYGLLYYALVGLNAGTASVILATAPLATLVLAIVHGQERFTMRGLVGGLLVITGIGILSLDTLRGDIGISYLIASVCGVLAVAESTVVIKSFPRSHPVVANAVGMSVGALFLVMTSLAFAEEWTLPQTGRTWLVTTWLIVAGSVGLFGLFLFVVGRWTASASVYAIAMMPVVAVTMGALLDDEEVSIELIIGGLLVIGAVYVGALSRDRVAPTPTAPLERSS